MESPNETNTSLIDELEKETDADVNIRKFESPTVKPLEIDDDDPDLDEKFKKSEASAANSTDFSADFDDEGDTPHPPTDEVPEYTPPTVTSRHKTQAKTYLRGFNILSRLLLKWGYKTKYLEPGDTKRLTEFRRNNRFKKAEEFQEAISSDSEMWGVIERFEVYQQVCDTISLDEDEYKEGLDIISELIADNPKLQVGPGASLLIWAGAVIGARIEPFFPEINNIIPGENGKEK